MSRLSVLAVAVIASALVLTACTSGDEAPPPSPPAAAGTAVPTSPTSTPQATAPAATATPRPRPPDDLAPEIPGGVPLVAPQPASPSDVLDDDGWPRGAVGPLVVYEREVREDIRRESGPGYSIGQTVTTVIEVVTFDLGTEEQLAAFEVGARNRPRVDLAGSRLFVTFGRSLWTYGLDGSGGVELFGAPDHDRYIERVAPNADGSLVAINHCPTAGPGCTTGADTSVIELIDAATGARRVLLRQARVPAEFVGVPGPKAWLRDQDVIVLSGWTYSGRPGGRALLSLDGGVEVLTPAIDPTRREDPEGRRPTVEYSGWQVACGEVGYGGVARIALLDVATGEELNALESPWPALHLAGVSPDGQEILLSMHLLPDEVGEALEQLAASRRCPYDQLQRRIDDLPVKLWMLPADGSPPFTVASRLEAHRRWWGPRMVSWVCAGEEVVGWSNSGSAPGVGLGGFSEQRCGQSDAEIELRVGGRPVDARPRLDVLGFVEAP